MYYKKTPAEAVRVAVPAGVFILKYARETAGGRSSALLPDQMIEKTARSSLSLNTGELSKFFTCDHLVALKIFVDCFLNYVIRKSPVVIRVRSQPVTCKLFVERRLSVSRFITFYRPETGAVRCQHLITDNHITIFIKTKFEFCICNNDTAA